MTTKLSFCHPGTFGDTVYSLVAVKMMGGGDVYIKLNAMYEMAYMAFGGLTAGEHSGRYTQQDLDFMFPLIAAQSYVTSTNIWKGESVNFDLGDHHKFSSGPKGWQGNQTECYALAVGLDIVSHKKQLLIDPWLDPVTAIKIPGRPIVINRTSRYLQGCEHASTWTKWVKEGLADSAVFVGTRAEHNAFNQQFLCNVPYQPVSDMLELARIIQGCEQFIGNQSMPLAIAIGLGKTFCCEVRKDFDQYRSPHGFGDVWFPRANGHYF